MKIVARICPPQSAKIIVQKQFSDLIENELIDLFDLDVGSERFGEYLELTKNEKKGTWFNPWMEFTEEELDQCDFLQPVCRGPVFSESDADFNQTRKWLDNSLEIETNKGTKVKLLARVCVKDRKLKPNTIAGALEWTPDYILPTNIVNIFKKSQLRGFSEKGVFNRKTKSPFKDFHLLYNEHFMPAATRVIYAPKGIPFEEQFEDEFEEMGINKELVNKIDTLDEDKFRLYGCLCYEDLNGKTLKDFNRTAEPWGGNDLPLWVVSRRVRDIYRKYKLRGWIFEPVLEKGSELYELHKNLWQKFIDAIQINRANRI